jgi:hypothetical protein
MTETPKESGGGYAEEQPHDLEPDQGGEERRREKEQDGGDGRGKGPGSESGDGKATGNPHDAG